MAKASRRIQLTQLLQETSFIKPRVSDIKFFFIKCGVARHLHQKVLPPNFRSNKPSQILENVTGQDLLAEAV